MRAGARAGDEGAARGGGPRAWRGDGAASVWALFPPSPPCWDPKRRQQGRVCSCGPFARGDVKDGRDGALETQRRTQHHLQAAKPVCHAWPFAFCSRAPARGTRRPTMKSRPARTAPSLPRLFSLNSAGLRSWEGSDFQMSLLCRARASARVEEQETPGINHPGGDGPGTPSPFGNLPRRQLAMPSLASFRQEPLPGTERGERSVLQSLAEITAGKCPAIQGSASRGLGHLPLHPHKNPRVLVRVKSHCRTLQTSWHRGARATPRLFQTFLCHQ